MEAFGIPFEPYLVQTAFHDLLLDNLRAGIHPVVALELPTGCGKTLSALSAVLTFQQEVRRMSLPERKVFYWRRSKHRQAILDAPSKNSLGGGEGEGEEEADESMDDLQQRFIQCFSNRGPGTGRSGKRQRRYDLPQGHLRQDHECPPLNIFYACRTHSQASQAAAELKHFRAASAYRQKLAKRHGQGTPQQSQYSIENLKMNIMASRERYCIHPSIAGKLRAHGGQGVESAGTNDLGEVCDKIVSYGQCEHWETFTQLADRALSGGLPARNVLATGRSAESKKQDNIWAIEDLVHGGETFTGCPYYASREMVFHADITYLTYNYLLDPIIRSETKFESAIENNSIVIFDEAHNIPDVCQDVLSHNFRLESLQGFSTELARLRLAGWKEVSDGPSALDSQQPLPSSATAASTSAAPVLQYPKQFRTKRWTLSQMFDFGYWLCIELQCFIEANCLQLLQSQNNQHPGDYANGNVRTRLVTGLISNLLDKVVFKCLHCRNASNFLSMLKDFTAIIQTLGVTFNPFDLSVPTVGGLKKLLLLLQSLGQHPEGFGVWFEVSSVGGETESGYSLQIRCLDSRFAFQHLLKKTYCCVLMSGTLAPFKELAGRLGFQVFDQPMKRRVKLLPDRKSKTKGNGTAASDTPGDSEKGDSVEIDIPQNTFTGRHVINTSEQCVIASLRKNNGVDFRCVRDAYASTQFMGALALAIWRLCSESCCVGGALVFLPNYSIAEDVFRRISALSEATKRSADAIPCVLEPRGALEFTSKFQWYKNRCVQVSRRRRTEIGDIPRGAAAVFIGVHRGKLSEGLDFVDEMARLVISVGVPYRPLKDQGVLCQRAYCGETWYLIDAIRSINQSLGRCIRHVNDFGAMVIIDSRFTKFSSSTPGAGDSSRRAASKTTLVKEGAAEMTSVNDYLSTWLKDSLVEFNDVDALIQEVRECQERNAFRWQPKLPAEGEPDTIMSCSSPTDVQGASYSSLNQDDSNLLRATGLPAAATTEARLSLYGLSKPIETKTESTDAFKAEPSSQMSNEIHQGGGGGPMKAGPSPLQRKPINPFQRSASKMEGPTSPSEGFPGTTVPISASTIPEPSSTLPEVIEIDDD